MKNIFKIIASDIKRLSVNVVAIVVIIGLSVLPCLYAWFNILSNWDPYGPDSTKNLQVAVASSDAGIVVGGAELNIGDKILSNLKENKSIGWVFTDTAAEAINGVYAGDYYAALVIDESFSRDMVSFLGGEIENPKIIYYENEKKNAIAPKITGKVKNTLKQQIDSAFVSTVAKVILEASDKMVSFDTEGNLTGEAISKLETLDGDLNAVILILDSYIALMDSTENLMAAGEAVTEQIDSMIESAGTMADSAKTAGEAVGTVVKTSASVLMSSLKSVSESLSTIQTKVNSILDAIQSGSSNIASDAELVESWSRTNYADWRYEKETNPEAMLKNSAKVKEVDDGYEKLLGKAYIEGFDAELEKCSEADKKQKATYTTISKIPPVTGDVYDLRITAEKASENTEHVAKVVSSDVATCQSKINELITEYNSSVAPSVQSSLDSVEDSLKEIESILRYKPTSIDQVAKTLKNYPSGMNSSKESLLAAKEEALEMDEKLKTLIEDTRSASENEDYQRIISLLENDPEYLASFISSPVKLSEEYIYEVANNGSASSPFYIVLSIWVGSLIMSTILKTVVKNTDGMTDLKNWQCFFGRYFITFTIGQIQTLITVLGALLYVGIQCEHPFLLWLACSWTATVFSFLLYSFTYAFGNLGEALSVILMVIQVAGAGGTFPIEVLPKVFQVLYKFMPFNYAMNAVRECVAGFYKNTYWTYLLCLIPFVLVAIINGVALYYPCKRLNHQIEISKEKSGILI